MLRLDGYRTVALPDPPPERRRRPDPGGHGRLSMDRAIRRLGIVNRGEPAVRALTAVAELNQAEGADRFETVVLYTDPDADSWFVREADVAVPLGPATFVDPADGTRRSRYLDEPAVIAALRGADVDAVWVGWGFVAEHASFAQACEEAGITFVGPDSATIRRLGDKMAAKRVAEQADVPVVPWSGGPVEDVAEATKACGADSATRWWSRRPPAAAGAGSGWSATTTNSPPRCRRRAPRRRWHSATPRSSWRSWCRLPATSRCR